MHCEFDVHIDESAHLAFSRLVCGRQYKRTAITCSAALALLLTIGLVIGDAGYPLVAGAVAGWIALCCLLAIQWLLLPRRVRKVFRQNRHLSEVQHFTVGLDELQIETELSSTRVPWDRIAKWDENDKVLALYPQALVAYLIPKTQVASEVSDFVRERVISSGLSAKSKERK